MFRRKHQKPRTTPTKYPEGTFVCSERGYFFIAGPNKRYHLMSKRVVDSWAPPRIVQTTESALKNYRIAAKMKFRNGSLIHNISDGKIYLIEKGLRRHLVSPEAFELIGANRNRDEVVSVSLEEIKLHEPGEDLA